MNCFYFSEQRFPHICLRVPIATVQHFILPIPDYRHFNFQRFRHSFLPQYLFLIERVLGYDQYDRWKRYWHPFLCLVVREDEQLPLIPSCWCSVDLLLIFFFLSPLLPCMNISFRTLQGGNLVLVYICFFIIFGSIFAIQRKVIVCFLSVLLLLLILRDIIYFRKTLRYSVSALNYFSEQILVALAKNPLNILAIEIGGIEMWLNLNVPQSWLALNMKFMFPFVIFYFYAKKVYTFFFMFIFYCLL